MPVWRRIKMSHNYSSRNAECLCCPVASLWRLESDSWFFLESRINSCCGLCWFFLRWKSAVLLVSLMAIRLVKENHICTCSCRCVSAGKHSGFYLPNVWEWLFSIRCVCVCAYIGKCVFDESDLRLTHNPRFLLSEDANKGLCVWMSVCVCVNVCVTSVGSRSVQNTNTMSLHKAEMSNSHWFSFLIKGPLECWNMQLD